MSIREMEEKVEEFLASRPESWFTSAELSKNLKNAGGFSQTNLYLAVSNLARLRHRIRRRFVEGTKMYEYANDPAAAPREKVETIEPRPAFQKQETTICWTAEERNMLAAEFVRIRKERPYIPASQVLYSMQLILPENRRRRYVKKMSEVPWLEKCIEQAKSDVADAEKATVTEEKQEAPAETQAVAAEPTPVVQEGDEPVVTEAEEVVTDPAKNGLSLESFGLDVILAEAAKRIGSSLKSLLIDVLSDPEVKAAMAARADVHVHHHHHHHSEQGAPSDPAEAPSAAIAEMVERRAEPRPPKPKIGIVSNRIDIGNELTKSFPQIKFVVTDKKYHEAVAAVKNCDKVILMTKFVSHSTNNNVKSACGDKIAMINGGYSDVKRMVNLWINQGLFPKE